MFFLYNIIINIFGPIIVLITFLKGRYGGFWLQRLGYYPNLQTSKNNRYWFHAASVGEVKSASSIIFNLLKENPKAEIFISVGSPLGIKISQETFKNYKNITTLPAVFDFFFSPNRAFKRLKSNYLIIIETELWPNLIKSAKKNNTKLILAAARLTERSYKRYLYIKNFMAAILNCFTLICPLGEIENTRYLKLGAKKTKILGNPKYDFFIEESQKEETVSFINYYKKKIWPNNKEKNLLFLAGSTHQGEEELIINSYLKAKIQFPKLKLMIAPRHLSRLKEIYDLLKSKNISYNNIDDSNINNSDIIIVNKIGYLFKLYGLCSVSFIGASLIKTGNGHNPLEAAAFKKPIIFGKYMSSFANEVKNLLKNKAAVEVDENNLTEFLLFFLQNPNNCLEYGENSYNALKNQNCAGSLIAKEILCI